MVRIHREPPMEGPAGGAVAYTHFGARFSAARQVQLLHPLPDFCAGSSTDENSWPTPKRCGFNSRTAHQAGLARRSSPRSIIAEVLVRFQHPAPIFRLNTGDWQRWLMHSPLKRDQAGSIPASPTRFSGIGRYGYALAF